MQFIAAHAQEYILYYAEKSIMQESRSTFKMSNIFTQALQTTFKFFKISVYLPLNKKYNHFQGIIIDVYDHRFSSKFLQKHFCHVIMSVFSLRNEKNGRIVTRPIAVTIQFLMEILLKVAFKRRKK